MTDIATRTWTDTNAIQNRILKKRKLQKDFSCLNRPISYVPTLILPFFKSLTLVSAFHSNLPFGRCCAWWGGEGCVCVCIAMQIQIVLLPCLVLSCLVLSCLHDLVLSFEPPSPPPRSPPRATPKRLDKWLALYKWPTHFSWCVLVVPCRV